MLLRIPESGNTSVYLLNMAIAIQYCDASGDTGNANLLRANVNAAMHKIDAAFKQIDELEARAAKGNDKLLVSGQIVSKTMQSVYMQSFVQDVDSWSDFNHPGISHVLTVTTDNLRSMAKRAKKRGLSLSDDLISAGFKNVTASSSKQYVYISKDTYDREFNNTGSEILSGFGAFFGKSYDDRLKEYCTDIVCQDGTNDVEVKLDFMLISANVYASSLWADPCYRTDVHGDFNYVIAFATPKK